MNSKSSSHAPSMGSFSMDSSNDPSLADPCAHFTQISLVRPSSTGCEKCLELGDTWVHLRLCMTCGHVGCCESSKNKHALKHFQSTGHPIVQSFEPDENWMWCYIDERYVG